MSDLLIKAPTQFEVLKSNRFLVRFPSDLGILSWWVQECDQPKITQTPTQIPFLNSTNYTLGKYAWEQMTMKLMEPIGPSAGQAVMEWVRLHSESITGRQGYAIAYKRDIWLEKLDPTGASISKWILKECMITGAQFSNMSYKNDDIATIDLTVQPYYCIHCY